MFLKISKTVVQTVSVNDCDLEGKRTTGYPIFSSLPLMHDNSIVSLTLEVSQFRQKVYEMLGSED